MPVWLLDTLQNKIHNPAWVLLALLLSSLLIRMQTFFTPIYNGDEANLFIQGMNILQGGLPYQDCIGKKPPLVYYMYGFLSWFSPNMHSIHVATAVLCAVSAFFLNMTFRLIGWVNAGIVAAWFYLIFSMSYIELDMWATNVEILANIWICLAFYLFSLSAKPVFSGGKFSKTYLLLTGVAIALASLCKHQYGIAILPVFIAIIYGNILTVLAFVKDVNRFPLCETKSFDKMENSKYKLSNKVIIRNAILDCFLSAIGMGVIYGFVLLWALYNNIFYVFIDYVIVENFIYITGNTGSSQPFHNAIFRIFAYLGSILPLLLLSYLLLRNGNRYTHSIEKKILVVFFVSYCVCTIPALIAGGRCYGHYFVQWIPGWVMLAALVFDDNARNNASSRNTGIQIKRLAFALTILLFIGFQLAGAIRTHNGSYEAVNPDIIQITQFITEQIKPGTFLFIWGNFTHPYYYSRTKPGSRFSTCEYLVSYRNQQIPMHVQQKRAEQLIYDLRISKPGMIVDTSSSLLFPYWYHFPLDHIPALKTLIQNNYIQITSIADVDIYIRNK